MISGSSMELDFKTLKRKDLQKLCKKHGLRANSTNAQMADGLASLFKNYEMEKQMKVRLRGSGKSSNKECERVEGKEERIIIILDDEEDEHVPVLGSGAMKYTSTNLSSSGKNEYIQADLEGSSVKGDSVGEKVLPCEENSIIFADQDDLHSGSALRSANRKHDRSSRKNVNKLCESRSANSEVSQIPVKAKRKRNCRNSSIKVNDAAAVSPPVEASHNDNLMGSEVLDNTQNRQEIEEYELHTDSSLTTSVSGICETKRPTKRTRDSLEVEISVMEKDIGEIGNTQLPEFGCTNEFIQPEVDLASPKILQSGKPSNLASSTPRLLLSELQDGQDGGLPEANEPLSKHRKEESKQEENLFRRNSIIAGITVMEVVDTSGRTFSSIELDRLSKDGETSKNSSAASLRYSQEIHDTNNERRSISANHIRKNEMEESLVCKDSSNANITLMEVVDASDKRLSFSELDHVSKDEEVSKQSSSTSLSYAQDIDKISKRCCSISTNLLRNFEDDCKKCFIADETYKSCAETPVPMNDFCLSSKQGCEAVDSAAIIATEVEMRCHNSEGVGEGREGEKRNEYFMEHEYHKDKQDEDECQEGYRDKANGSCSFVKASAIVSQEKSIAEDDVLDTISPSTEKNEERNDNAGLSLNIEICDDDKLHYLAGKELEKVGRTDFLEVVQKKEEDVKTLGGRSFEALEDNSSTELKLSDATEVTANNLLTCEDLRDLRMSGDKFQEQAEDYGQNLGMLDDKFQEQAAEYGQDLGLLGDKFQEKAADSGQVLEGYCEDTTEESENIQKSLDRQKSLAPAEINSCLFFGSYESATPSEELSVVKGGGSSGLVGNIQIVPEQLKLDGPEEPVQSVGYHKDLEESLTKKIAEIAPAGLSNRVDKLMEKLLCLGKVLRGEITPPVKDSCLPGEEEISCEESHLTSMKKPESEQEDEVVKILMPRNCAHEDCEEYSPNSQLNINHDGSQCLQDILDSQADPIHEVDAVSCIESFEANKTDTTSPFECNFSCNWPIEGQPHQGSDVDVKELLDNPGEDLLVKIFLSTTKHSIDLEGEKNSVANCISKKTKLKHNLAEDNNYFGSQCISDALDGHIPIVQEGAHSKSFDILLEVESENNSLPRTDAFASELKASVSRNTVDSLEEINGKLIKFRISSSRKATKSNIKTPRTKSTGIFELHSSVDIIRDKKNKQSTKTTNFSSSEHKLRSSASAGPIRRPLQSITNQTLD